VIELTYQQKIEEMKRSECAFLVDLINVLSGYFPLWRIPAPICNMVEKRLFQKGYLLRFDAVKGYSMVSKHKEEE
jgi:hypothetical protein